jgi:molecular chaperone GrpE
MVDEQKVSVMEGEAVGGEAGAEVDTGTELDLDGDGNEDLEGAMRDAVAAVEEVQDRKRPVSEAATEEVEALRQEVAELRDRSVRTLAELDNFRKRAERERGEVRRYALVDPMRDLLDVVDNLERAMAASGSFEDLKTGVEMILHQMRELLRQYGVQMVEAEGRPFDPNLHEAVARVEESDLDSPRVIQELQRGYKIHDRLLRPSRVRVAVPAEGARDSEGEDPGKGDAEASENSSGNDP